MLKAFAIFALTVLALGQSRNDPFKTLTSYEQRQRASAEMDDENYHLVPFRLSGQSQHFLIAPKVNEEIRVEVVVHWMNSNSSLLFPQFDLTQKVRLTIEEENLATMQRPLLTREFLTQTGFKLKLQGGKKYRLRVQSVGKQTKLVELAMTSKPKQIHVPVQFAHKNHTSEMLALQEMRANLQSAQRRWIERQQQPEREEVNTIWAWMSGLEMASLFLFVGVQIALFERFALPSSVI